MLRGDTLKSAVLAMAMVGVGCGGESPYQHPLENVDGIAELGQPITALATAPTFTALTGTLAVTMAAGEVAIVSKHPVSGAILVNDVATSGATATTTKVIAITASGAVHTVILDFANGTFAPGITAKPGITIDWGATAGINAFKLRGSTTAADTITVGKDAAGLYAVAFNTDAFEDVAITNGKPLTDTYTFSLGGGNDIFGADAVSAVKYLGTGATAMPVAVTVYGGPGDDTFEGGLGADTFYGDIGNDTFKGGPVALGGVKASVQLTGTKLNSVVQAVLGGTGGNSLTFTSVAGGPAAGSLTHVGNVITLNYLTGTTTIAEAEALINASGVITVKTTATSTGSTTLVAGDAAGPTSLTGGTTVTKTFIGGGGTGDVADFSLRAEDLKFQPDGTAASGAGGAGGEAIIISRDVEILKGGSGNDTFIPNATEGHAFTGNGGINLVDYSAVASAITVTMGDSLANDGVAHTVASGVLMDNIGSDVQNIKCASGFACTVTGNGLDNTFIVPAGSTVAHSFSGGAGVDTVDFSALTSALSVTMDFKATATTNGMLINTDVENVKCPTAAVACTVVGNSGNNHIWGGGGLNTISTLDGDDIIEGVGGADVIDCGDGSDILILSTPITTGSAVNCEL